eukprot:COSAG02_NODE_8695_length_2477_cov_1.684188_4_plen_27_part_01
MGKLRRSIQSKRHLHYTVLHCGERKTT